jgi:cytochrome P450
MVSNAYPYRRRGRGSTTTLVPFRRTLAALAGEPLAALAALAGQGDAAALVRLDLGLFRPYLVARPEHVQHVLVSHADNYLRGEMLWKPVRLLIGGGLGNEGSAHAASRSRIQPLLAARNVDALIDLMAATTVETVDELAASGQSLDATMAMTRIMHRTLVRAFFADRIGAAEAAALGEAISVAFTSLGARLLLPFVPGGVPLPGERAFRRAVRRVDAIVYPLIRRCRRESVPGNDLVSLLCHARDERGVGLDDRQVRDDLVAVFVAGSETAAVALTWLWVVLDGHPDIAAALTEEVHGVVGTGRPAAVHLRELRYTRMVLQELLRLYPPGWLIPRTAQAADVIDGVPIDAGATVLLSPYLTHRLPYLWPRPDDFDPHRFEPEQVRARPRFAYFPFGGGTHQCLGSHFFTVQAQLIVVSLLRGYRISRPSGEPVQPRASVTLRPRQPVRIELRPCAA